VIGHGGERPTSGKLTVRQAAFIGVGAMVGAGIFSLLGAAVWLWFLIAGAIALLQGYSFAKFGARFPSAAGLLEHVVRGLGNGHVTGIIAWLILAANALVTGMVAVSFGSYASAALTDGSTVWIKVFAVLLVLAMTLLSIVGWQAAAKTPDGHRLRRAHHPHALCGHDACQPRSPRRDVLGADHEAVMVARREWRAARDLNPPTARSVGLGRRNLASS
jgi:hypothetical protein